MSLGHQERDHIVPQLRHRLRLGWTILRPVMVGAHTDAAFGCRTVLGTELGLRLKFVVQSFANFLAQSVSTPALQNRALAHCRKKRRTLMSVCCAASFRLLDDGP